MQKFIIHFQLHYTPIIEFTTGYTSITMHDFQKMFGGVSELSLGCCENRQRTLKRYLTNPNICYQTST